jgi:hypothetical protein
LIAIAPDLTREFIEFNRKAHQPVVHGKPLLAKVPDGRGAGRRDRRAAKSLIQIDPTEHTVPGLPQDILRLRKFTAEIPLNKRTRLNDRISPVLPW